VNKNEQDTHTMESLSQWERDIRVGGDIFITRKTMPSTIGTVCPRTVWNYGCNTSERVQRTSGEKASATSPISYTTTYPHLSTIGDDSRTTKAGAVAHGE